MKFYINLKYYELAYTSYILQNPYIYIYRENENVPKLNDLEKNNTFLSIE